jgi:16S rRNA (guanine1207-N2)-methyltransferase
MSMPRSTRALLDRCPTRPPGRALDIASYHGEVARRLGCAYLHDHLSACEQARAAGVDPVYHADLLPADQYAHIFLDARELDPALAAEFVAQAASRLAPDGTLYATAARQADVEACFNEVEVLGGVLVARSPKAETPPVAMTTYSLELGGQILSVQSAPGIFSPRGLDPGTREMLAVIAAHPGQRFLDLGCGAGVVSLVATRLWGCQVTAVDVSARALHVTRLNAPDAEVVASDGFRNLTGRQFDVIAANPPYHTDFAVAKGFIEGAYSHLAPGGWLYLVVKRADWYIQKIRGVFGGCRVVERAGYTILSAEKRAASPRPVRNDEPKTTKKHARRMASVKRRRP